MDADILTTLPDSTETGAWTSASSALEALKLRYLLKQITGFILAKTDRRNDHDEEIIVDEESKDPKSEDLAACSTGACISSTGLHAEEDLLVTAEVIAEQAIVTEAVWSPSDDVDVVSMETGSSNRQTMAGQLDDEQEMIQSYTTANSETANSTPRLSDLTDNFRSYMGHLSHLSSEQENDVIDMCSSSDESDTDFIPHVVNNPTSPPGSGNRKDNKVMNDGYSSQSSDSKQSMQREISGRSKSDHTRSGMSTNAQSQRENMEISDTQITSGEIVQNLLGANERNVNDSSLNAEIDYNNQTSDNEYLAYTRAQQLSPHCQQVQ
ncbi:hypothetical protein KUTeg_010852 [Tegillarca granosa]|uniref:Uncharacterized protein n=1 Tax=Tegillarca granosa TaxID=220873 RepID=A0ABQ9F286_TEGGR|nr:hypothetical protein KUTeg_010852 [Tegillarca granosa]